MYGLTLEMHEEFTLRQDNSCAICMTHFSECEEHVDHDHKTGKIRGLLCEKCNRGLGFFNDDPDIIDNAVRYLENN